MAKYSFLNLLVLHDPRNSDTICDCSSENCVHKFFGDLIHTTYNPVGFKSTQERLFGRLAVWNRLRAMNTAADIREANRAALVTYLESWGFACYESESETELRTAAQQTFDTEGPGYGPMKIERS